MSSSRRTLVALAAVLLALTAVLAGHMSWDLRGYAVPADVAPVEVQEVPPPAVTWDVSGTEPLVFAHEAVLATLEGSLRVVFTTDDPALEQGLFSRDHTGFGTGGHTTLTVQDGGLTVRMQSDSATELDRGPVGTVEVGVEHEVVLTFGSGGTDLYLDGEHLGSWLWDGGMAGNTEPVVIGGSQTSSTAGTADDIRHPIQGDVSVAEFYDVKLTTEEVGALAGGGMDFALTARATWSEAEDEGPVSYRWTLAPASGFSGASFELGETTELTEASVPIPFDPDGTAYVAEFCVTAVDEAGLENAPRCVQVDVPAQPEVDTPPGPIDSVEVEVQIDTIMAMAPEREEGWIFARWSPGDGVAWYRTYVTDGAGTLAWRNENNWSDRHPWGATGFYVPRRAASYEATLVLEGYADRGDYKAWPVPQAPVETARFTWTVPAAGECSDYRGRQMTCRP